MGRSTHIALLRTWLESRGHAVLDTGMTRSVLAGRGIKEAKTGHTLGRLTMQLFYQMHIAAKRLRYALELFEQCWGKPVALIAKRVAALQSELGELHDCDVWIVDFGDELEKARKQARPAGDETADHSVASVWLLDHFVKLRTKHFRRALQRWREWEANDFSGQLRCNVEADFSAAAVTTGKGNITSTKTTGCALTRQV